MGRRLWHHHPPILAVPSLGPEGSVHNLGKAQGLRACANFAVRSSRRGCSLARILHRRVDVSFRISAIYSLKSRVLKRGRVVL